MATIHDLFEVTDISQHTTYSHENGKLLGVVDNVSSSDLNDGEFDEGDRILIGGVSYTIDRIQEPKSSGRFTQGDGTDRSFNPGSESNLNVVFLTVSNGGTTRHFIIPNDSYGNMNIQSIRTGEIEDVAGNDAAVISTSNNSTSVVCFGSGTMISTLKGEVPIEALRPDDMVCTMDNGPQRVLMTTMRRLGPAEFEAAPHLKPVEIAAGAFQNDRPLVVSPQHGVLLKIDNQQIMARAIHLARLNGGAVRQLKGCRRFTYWHIVLEHHQVVYANGIPSESYFPGPTAVASLAPDARRELTTLLPGINLIEDLAAARRLYGGAARAYSRTSHLPDRINAFCGVGMERQVYTAWR